MSDRLYHATIFTVMAIGVLTGTLDDIFGASVVYIATQVFWRMGYSDGR